jgi:hypothetical protein
VARPPRPIAERFWEKVDKRGPVPVHVKGLGRCWVWTAGVATDGYGKFQVSPHTRRAHRVAYELHHGVDPGGQQVLHQCDNPLCVRPEHLFLGSDIDNIRDMEAKDRRAYGERSGRARLTTEQVQEVKRLFAAGYNKSQLSRMFGYTRYGILSILRGDVRKRG